jgi:hypothetical protein
MTIFGAPLRGISLSEALAEAYAVNPVNVVIIDTLEFTHSSFSAPVRLVNDHKLLTAGLETGAQATFQACYFTLKKPSESDSSKPPALTVTIGNAGRIMNQYLKLAKGSREPIRIKYRVYLNTDLTQPHINPPLDLCVLNTTIDIHAVSIRAGLEALVNRRFPAVEYTAQKFAGLAAR